MDLKALYKISYGVFVLGTKNGNVLNACITNTCMQVTNEPALMAFTVINTNYTAELIKKSRQFAISLLDTTCPFDVIKHFGYQSGRTVNKFASFPYKTDALGSPYITEHVCAVLSGKIIFEKDLGTHTLFIAELTDAVSMSDNEPMTYAYYQAHVKPRTDKPATDKKIVGWKCKICGYIYKGANLPSDYICPVCGHDANDFEPIYE